MARQDYEGAPISGVTGNVAGSTTSDAGSSQSRGFTDPGSQGENTVIQPTRFNLNNNPNSTTITRSPLQQFRFNRDAERASRVVSYTPANIAEFEAATGRTRTNPYGPNGITGMMQNIFGAENVQLDAGKQAEYNAIYELNLDKFMNPDLQSKIGLRGMVGDPVTGGNTIAKQVAPMSTSEMGARLGITAATPLGPILSLLPGNNVSYVSTGNEEVYDVERDPRFNKDLSSGIMGNIGKMLAGGVDLQEAGGRVMDLGRKGLDSLTERFGSDLNVPAGVMGNLSPAPADFEESVGATSDTTGMFRVGDQFVSTSKYEPEFITQGTTPQLQQELTELANDDILRGRDFTADQITPFSPSRYDNLTKQEGEIYGDQQLRSRNDQAFLSEQFGLTPSQMMLNARELNQDVGLPGGNLQLEYNPDTNTKGIQYNVPINSLLRMLG